MAHVNLREESLPYKHIIGQVLLDKNPSIKTIVNKTGSIETEYRTFPMELLAGENNYNVLLRESGATFNFNFAEVYWNSRLQMEHSRVINWISGLDVPVTTNSSQNIRATKEKGIIDAPVTANTSSVEVVRKEVVVADMMAGVDLNPASYKYLVLNGRTNHCGSRLIPFNMDGRLPKEVAFAAPVVFHSSTKKKRSASEAGIEK
eukprot:gene27258-33952_t